MIVEQPPTVHCGRSALTEALDPVTSFHVLWLAPIQKAGIAGGAP